MEGIVHSLRCAVGPSTVNLDNRNDLCRKEVIPIMETVWLLRAF